MHRQVIMEIPEGKSDEEVCHDIIHLLVHCRMEEHTPVNEHFSYMCQHMDLLESYGHVVKEETRMCLILLSLPISFHEFVSKTLKENKAYNPYVLVTDLVRVQEGIRKLERKDEKNDGSSSSGSKKQRKSVFSEERMGKNWKSYRKT